MRSFDAILLDLDGVVTATRKLHIEAWKKAFDGVLKEKSLKPFDPDQDYKNTVDGRPREEGIRAFLRSRDLNWGQSLIEEIAKKKDQIYLELLGQYGPGIFKDALEELENWKKRGIPLAIVSSSRNCAEVLKKAGVENYFQVRVDGKTGAELQLRGKPEPDYFLEAAKRLGVSPSRCMLIEDAESGVEAGKRGGFGLVIGIDRTGRTRNELLAHGADEVISSLRDLA